jgi:hypothetical protein
MVSTFATRNKKTPLKIVSHLLLIDKLEVGLVSSNRVVRGAVRSVWSEFNCGRLLKSSAQELTQQSRFCFSADFRANALSTSLCFGPVCDRASEVRTNVTNSVLP